MADYEDFKTWMTNQPKQHPIIGRCGVPAFWLKAGYRARQEVVYDMIHQFPGHITTNIFSTLAQAFTYARIWGTPKAADLVKEFRALIVYQIAQLVEDTFNYATTTAGCKKAHAQRCTSINTMCMPGFNSYVDKLALPEDFLNYPALPMGPSSSKPNFTAIDEPIDVGNSGRKRKFASSE
ncbi:hypothetical protein D0863_09932 [Hortaea werneckii]|uniref:Uncharacterized protein n=1 Tax=Hortaea werneckii TaxID=91943 RepID=A0A3M7DJ72_HORWE|nr:hypothetical protein D0863_09932 [Hortaea werneckii]